MDDKTALQNLLDESACGIVTSRKVELFQYLGKSDCWKSFQKIKLDGDVAPYVVCNDCGALVKYTPSDGTGSMKRHVHRMAPTKQGSSSGVQLKISGYASCNPTAYTKAKKQVTAASVKFCAMDIRPFSTVEGAGFKDLASTFVNIGATFGRVAMENIIPSAQTIANNVKEKYEEVKLQVMKELGKTADLFLQTATAAAGYPSYISRYATPPAAYAIPYGREYADPYHPTITPAAAYGASVYRGGYARYTPY